jgi:dihydroneopterin aldolase
VSDRIVLHGIEVEALIGVHEHERLARRPLVVDLDLLCDLHAASRSDDVEDTVDYSALTSRVRERCRETSYRLIEALAGDLADLCLDEPRVRTAIVTVHKHGAVAGVADVAVSLERSRSIAR